MQMRAGRAPGRADPTDHLADANALADTNVDFRQMAVAGGKSVAVIDLDHLAVAAAPAGRRHGSRSRSVGRLAIAAAEIYSRVHCRHMQERIDAHAEWRGEIDLAGHRLAHRHGN